MSEQRTRLLGDLDDIFNDVDEDNLFASVSADNANKEDWSAYRDFLVARGDIRGQVMTLIEQLRRDPAPPDADAKRLRLRELSPQIDPRWLNTVTNVAPPYNCGAALDKNAVARFEFECPMRWDELPPTEQPSVRHCDRCDQSVYWFDTIKKAEKAARKGQCIAVPLPLARNANRHHQGPYVMMGGFGDVRPTDRMPHWANYVGTGKTMARRSRMRRWLGSVMTLLRR